MRLGVGGVLESACDDHEQFRKCREGAVIWKEKSEAGLMNSAKKGLMNYLEHWG